MTVAPRWSLPDNPDLNWLRNRAKQLRDAAAAADPEALALVERYDPPVGGPVPLSRAQRVLARAFGFTGWSALRQHLARIATYSRAMEPSSDEDGPAERFLRLACLSYTAPGRADEAERMRAADPDLAAASAATMAACGRADDLAALLSANPAAVSIEVGPHGWVPLLYLCYSRLRQDDARATLAVLLRAGSDPNAGFLWQGLPSPFTALTGVLGGGERGEPPHPDGVGLAELLLDAGADPNDNQALYNRMFTPDDSHLPPLLTHGLGRDLPSPWRERFGSAYPSPREMVGEHLRSAAASGFTERVRLLLAHGVDPNTRGYHPILGDQTAYEVAVRNGNRDAARLLAAAGGSDERLDDVDRLLSAALAGDRDAVANAPPSLRADAVTRRPDTLRVAAEHHAAEHHAADHHGVAALELLLAIGFDLDAAGPDGCTALHQAALDGADETCRWLLAHGADRDVRDRHYDATPAGWAAHAGHDDLARRLQPDQ